MVARHILIPQPDGLLPANRFQPQRGHIAHRPHDFLLGIRSAAGNDSHVRPPGRLPRRQLEQAQSFQPPQRADAGSLLVATGGRHPMQMLADRVDELGPRQTARLDRFLNVLDFLRRERAPGQKFRCSVSDQLAAPPEGPQYHLKTVFACPLLFRDKINLQVGLSRSNLAGSQTMRQRCPLCGSDREFPSHRDFYFQASIESVALLDAGYNYDSHWNALSMGLSPIGLTSSLTFRVNCSKMLVCVLS